VSAAEEVDLLQVLEEPRARIAARRALENVHGKRLVVLQARRVELGSGEVARDEQDVAAHALAAGRAQPITIAVLDQLDEVEAFGRQVTAEDLPFVGRVDGNGADGLLLRMDRGHGKDDHGGEQPQAVAEHDFLPEVVFASLYGDEHVVPPCRSA
jgi:hypothetical protein